MNIRNISLFATGLHGNYIYSLNKTLLTSGNPFLSRGLGAYLTTILQDIKR